MKGVKNDFKPTVHAWGHQVATGAGNKNGDDNEDQKTPYKNPNPPSPSGLVTLITLFLLLLV